MDDRGAALAASRAEVQSLVGQRLSELAPSRRDFAMFVATQRRDLAVIAHLRARAGWDVARTVAHARACDDAEVAALAVTTDPAGLSVDHMAAIVDATAAPVLRTNLVVHPSQLQYGRLHGADAAVLPASPLDAVRLRDLVDTARSLHMASVIEVVNDAEIELAARLPHVLIGLRCSTAGGRLDVEATRRLAARVPPQCPCIALPELRSPAEYAALCGVCDAVCAGDLLYVSDVAAALREVMRG
jgi:indole-3-glycerol phosphate synthase